MRVTKGSGLKTKMWMNLKHPLHLCQAAQDEQTFIVCGGKNVATLTVLFIIINVLYVVFLNPVQP